MYYACRMPRKVFSFITMGCVSNILGVLINPAISICPIFEKIKNMIVNCFQSCLNCFQKYEECQYKTKKNTFEDENKRDIWNFLENIQLTQYYDIIVDQGFDSLEMFCTISDDELKTIVDNFDDRQKIPG